MYNSFATPWTVIYQVSLSTRISKEKLGVGCLALLQGIFLTQGLNPCLLRWQADSLPPSHQGSPPTQWYIAALFIIAKTWREPRYPSVGKWIHAGEGSRWPQAGKHQPENADREAPAGKSRISPRDRHPPINSPLPGRMMDAKVPRLRPIKNRHETEQSNQHPRARF